MANFARQVDAWISKAQNNLDTVYKESVIRTAQLANTPIALGGRMPVDTGALMRSICASSDGGTAEGPRNFASAIRTASPLSPIAFGWNASYAEPVEFGAQGREPRAFARTAAAAFPAIVEQVAAEVNI